MKHDGWRVRVDRDKGETAKMLYLAVGVAAAQLADPVEAGSVPKGKVGAADILPFIRADESELFMLACQGRNTSLRFFRTGGPDEYELDVDLYEGDTHTLLDLAEALLRVYVILTEAKAGSR